MNLNIKIAVIGATGMVGRNMLKVLEEKKYEFKNILFGASENSINKNLIFFNKKYKITDIKRCLKKNPKIVLFAVNNEISKKWIPKFIKKDIIVIDNSSYWRLHKNVKLIIPEINSHLIKKSDKIISNPNCATIQLLIVMNIINKLYPIKEINISTYQSVTGSGMKGVNQLNNEIRGLCDFGAYDYPIYQNVIPQCDEFIGNGYTKEEMKIIRESRKILNKKIKIYPTSVRVPVIGGHSESVCVRSDKKININKIKKAFNKEKIITLKDDIKNKIYPMPVYVQNDNKVHVGRIRKSIFDDKILQLWIVSDNLRKGSSSNAIQILKYIIKKYF